MPNVRFVGGKGTQELTDISEQLTTVNSNTTKIDNRLQNRLDAWKRYRANSGEMEMKRWVQATQGSYGNPNRYGSGYGKWVRSQEKGIHGNSLDATGPHDLYVIRQRGTDQVLHFGETGRGYEVRGDEWVRKLKSEYGLDTYFEHLRTVEGKRAAKGLESRYIKTYERLFGRKPGFTDENGSFIQTQKTEH